MKLTSSLSLLAFATSANADCYFVKKYNHEPPKPLPPKPLPPKPLPPEPLPPEPLPPKHGPPKLDVSGVENFQAAARATSTCTIICPDNGFATNVNLKVRYGGKPYPTATGEEFSDSSNRCDITLLFTSEIQQSSLGFEITADSYDDLVLTCYCDKTYGGGGGSGSGCFSKDSNVEVEGQGMVNMEDLKIGDKVRTESGAYTPVYAFGHQNKEMTADFIQIYMKNAESPLEMTGNHLVFKDGEAVRADTIKIGDVLSSGEVIKLDSETKHGLYMPLTTDGTIVVDGTLASSYVSIYDEAPTAVDNSKNFLLNEQNIIHWWLSPFRMMCMGVSGKFCGGSHTTEGILNYLAAGLKIAEFADKQNYLVQHIMGLPLLFIFAVFNVTEYLFGASMAPAALMLGVASLIWYTKKSHMEGTGIEAWKKEV